MAKNKHILIGRLGEDIACGFLKNRRFRIIERNYRKKWGEIDIIAKKDNVLHFIEVKTSECNSFKENRLNIFSPEERVNKQKLMRLERTIKTYLIHRNVDDGQIYTFDIAVVFLNLKEKKAHVDVINDVLFD